MFLTFNKPNFTCRVSFENRALPRTAGFQWDENKKTWYTQSPSVAARLRQYADENARKEINRILLVHKPWSGRIEFKSELTPYDFQLEGVKFALERNKSYIAFDPGLGKTAVAAIVSCTLKYDSCVYICPPFLMKTVEYEFLNWGAKTPFIVSDTMIHKPEIRKQIMQIGIKSPSLLFVDEAHRFNNPTSRRSKMLFGYQPSIGDSIEGITSWFSKIVLLSGTPMPNRPIELFPILNACAPETIEFMNRFEYGRYYCAGFRTEYGWDFSGASRMQELAAKVKGEFMLRKRKKEVLKELPEKTEGLVLIGDDLPRTIDTLDRSILRDFSPTDLMGFIAPNDHIATYRKELGKLKVAKSCALIKDLLLNSNESILIFAIHKEVVAKLVKGLSAFDPLVVTGDVPTQKRAAIVKEFQTNKKRRLFIGNIDACGIGFTLTKATRVDFVEFSWVPSVNEQASDRAHRIGQTSNVLVQYHVFKNSIDRVVIETILRKRKVTKHI